jgi:arylsulfatase A-like enzyme
MITLTATHKATLVKRPDATWYFRNQRHPVRRTSLAGPAAWIDGRYKLVMGRGDQSQQVELYDLEADRREANNIASQHPDKVDAMTRQLRGWQRSIENSLTGADYSM